MSVVLVVYDSVGFGEIAYSPADEGDHGVTHPDFSVSLRGLGISDCSVGSWA